MGTTRSDSRTVRSFRFSCRVLLITASMFFMSFGGFLFGLGMVSPPTRDYTVMTHAGLDLIGTGLLIVAMLGCVNIVLAVFCKGEDRIFGKLREIESAVEKIAADQDAKAALLDALTRQNGAGSTGNGSTAARRIGPVR